MDISKMLFFTNISILYRKFQAFVNAELEKFDIHSSELPYLIVLLFIKDLVKQDEFAKITKIDKTATSKALKTLEQKKYIFRQECEKNKKQKEVYALQKAIDLKPHIEECIKKWSALSYKDLEEEEMKIFCYSLQKMALQVEYYQAPIKYTNMDI